MTPAMRPNWRSSGAATDDAIVSGLAPGSAADTWMVGKSTCGSGATGSSRKPTSAGQRERDGQQRGRDRPPDERRGDVHGGSAARAGLAAALPIGDSSARARRARRSKAR